MRSEKLIDPGLLTNQVVKAEQFDTLRQLLRGKSDSPGTQAARLVLVGGMTASEAGNRTGTSRQNVHNTVARYRRAHSLLIEAYST